MKQLATLSVFATVLTLGSAVAQTPYAGLQIRSIKALSDQQIADLRAGRGMGLALAAELNGYPAIYWNLPINSAFPMRNATLLAICSKR